MISSPKALDLLQIGSSMPQFSLVQAADELAKKVAAGTIYIETFCDVWFSYLAEIATAYHSDLKSAADAISSASVGSGKAVRINSMTELEKAQKLRELAGARRFSIPLFASLALDYSITLGQLEKAQTAFQQPSAVTSR
ncbi:hypothetical protein ACR3H8_19710 [Pseudomonas aeruginosa]|nr:hypothetical protein [Pseudomonas aeruginosa]EIU2716182.1 hypothetical protein [Pseudomonas aeruginosa]EIU2863001.1 hypothetical protein [Pseudomonas aeruginosa]ELD5773036.1 hypothetical protein [Pseudomonas aeruginosa]ERW61184.1 hypothetical protein Q024_06503 [Pseudomonas aeruginosa BWHPSA011]ETV55823.1 hypothetical protein Q042_05232 [Pseudomonas aeruginosa BWHPSA037]